MPGIVAMPSRCFWPNAPCPATPTFMLFLPDIKILLSYISIVRPYDRGVVNDSAAIAKKLSLLGRSEHKLFDCGHVHSIGRDEFRIRHFSFEPHMPVGRFFFRLDQKREPV